MWNGLFWLFGSWWNGALITWYTYRYEPQVILTVKYERIRSYYPSSQCRLKSALLFASWLQCFGRLVCCWWFDGFLIKKIVVWVCIIRIRLNMYSSGYEWYILALQIFILILIFKYSYSIFSYSYLKFTPCHLVPSGHRRPMVMTLDYIFPSDPVSSCFL